MPFKFSAVVLLFSLLAAGCVSSPPSSPRKDLDRDARELVMESAVEDAHLFETAEKKSAEYAAELEKSKPR